MTHVTLFIPLSVLVSSPEREKEKLVYWVAKEWDRGSCERKAVKGSKRRKGIKDEEERNKRNEIRRFQSTEAFLEKVFH